VTSSVLGAGMHASHLINTRFLWVIRANKKPSNR